MSSTRGILEDKFAELARWEKRKRREQIFFDACCAALLVAIITLPLLVFSPAPQLRWLVPAIVLAGFLPWLLYRRRWRRQDEVRAIAALDRSLQLDERALTAWDIHARANRGAAAELVLQQARDRLGAIEPKKLFPRRRSWAAVLMTPLFAAWLTLLWLEIDRQRATDVSSPKTLAQRARDYAREFQERARNEGLGESLKLGEELEKVARQGVENKSGDEQFRKELGSIAQKFEDAAKANSGLERAAGESRQSLQDLQAELAAMRDLPELAELPKGAEEPGRRWAERLASMPQLKRRWSDAEQSGKSAGQSNLRAFLDQLEKRVAGELDRRALIDAQQYLEQMVRQGKQQQGEHFAQGRQTAGEEEAPGDGRREKNAGNLPGKETGQKTGQPPSLPEFRAESAAELKGALREGESRALLFKGKPLPGKSTVPPSEVVASYRRQAEQELNSERVPAPLKETIKNYFLSLGDEGK